MKNVSQIQERISEILGQSFNTAFIFKGMPMYCHANTWEAAVEKLTKEANSVLMDLRGITHDRKGCEYEVGYLIDNVPLHKITFLLDTKVDKEGLYELFNGLWHKMSADSPNVHLNTPTLKIYTIGENSRKNIRMLLSLLIISTRTAADNEKEPYMIRFA